MKDYSKQYENVFTNYRTTKKCKLERVGVDKEGLSVDKYLLLFNKTIGSFQRRLFDDWVKITWLMRRFCYMGKRRTRLLHNGRVLDGAFGVFMRRFVGYDNRFITLQTYFPKIVGYLDDFFPDFDINSPFETKYKYPYKRMSLECLVLVYQIPERLELLAMGEKKRMSYTEFQDYIINYINCYNEENGMENFTFMFVNKILPYVRYNKNYEGGTKKT